MPSRKMTDDCPRCGTKNHLRAKYCNQCGGALAAHRAKRDSLGRMKLHADIGHPVGADCRRKIQEAVLAAFQRELELSRQPGYQPVDLDDEDDNA